MKYTNNFKIIVFSMLLVFGLAACDNSGPAETAGKNIDQTLDKAGDKISETADEVRDTIDEQSK